MDDNHVAESDLNEEMIAPIFRKKPNNFQPNLFTESRQEFTKLEKRIVALVVNQVGDISVKGQIISGRDLIVTIPFTQLTDTNHKVIADSAESLQSKRLIYRNDSTHKLDIITPFPRIRFEMVGRQRVIELTMFSAIVQHFVELGKRYTKYDIDIMLSLSSVYSQRMFEITSMYFNRGQRQFKYSVSQILEMLNCPEYYTYNDLRKSVLVVAQKELQEKSNIHFDWTTRKEGKKVVELLFAVKTEREIAIDAISEERRQINKMPINEAVSTAWQHMKNYKLKDWQKDLIGSDPELLNIFLRVDSELANGLRTNIKNPTAYLVKSLGIDQTKSPASRTKEPRAKSVTATTKTDVPTARKATTQIIGDVFGDIIGSK